MSDNYPCGLLIKQISDSLEKRANNSLRSQDLTMAQVNVLLRLDDMPEKISSLKDLERFLGVAQSTTAGIVARLEQKGFVEGFGDPSDKRVKMLRLTKLGATCCTEARGNIKDTELTLLNGLTTEEERGLTSLLQAIYDNIK